jgi:hypothetical protein
MSDPSSNPYSSFSGVATNACRRPVGSLILALAVLFLGISLGGGVVIRLVQTWPSDSEAQRSIDYSPFALLGTVALAAIAASVGLLSGHRAGWWVAMALCYILFSTFVLLPILHNGWHHLPQRRAAYAGVCLAYWLYLRRNRVRAYYGEPRPRWHLHLLIFVFSLVAMFLLGFR